MKTGPFVQGVLAGVRVGAPKSPISAIQSDLVRLTAHQSVRRTLAREGVKAVLVKPLLAKTCVAYRLEHPQVELEPSTVVEQADPASLALQALTRWKVEPREFPPIVADYLSGIQIGLQQVCPHLTDEILDYDARVMRSVFPKLEKRWGRGQLSAEDLAITLGTAYADFRMADLARLTPARFVLRLGFSEQRYGRLHIRTRPDAVTIYVDGEDVGKSEKKFLKLAVPVGKRVVEGQKKGYEKNRKKVEVVHNGPAKVRLVLSRH